MFAVLYARDPGSFRGGEWPTPCGYRYCHAPECPVGLADHEQCLEAESKLYSNGIATETNLLKRALNGP